MRMMIQGQQTEYRATILNDNNEVIEVSELSSGEKIIIALLLSAYAAQQKVNKVFDVEIPELILFDELDAQLASEYDKNDVWCDPK